MADSRFIKTVPFGGYDKTDVDKRLESLYLQVFDLKNELREYKLLLDELKKGAEDSKAIETVLAGERSMLTSAQVQKETLSDKLKSADDENKAKDAEIAALREEVKNLKATCEENDSKLALLSAGSDAAALGAVFVQAQKAADMVISESKNKAAEIEGNAKKLVENMVDDANNKASVIIYEAEKRAAEIDAQTQNNEEKAKVAQGNMRAVLLTDVNEYLEQVKKLRETFENIEKETLSRVSESEKLLTGTRDRLTVGGIPEFKNPKAVEPVIPEFPEIKPIDNTYPTGADKKKSTATKDSLEKIAAMASALDSDDDDADEKPAEEKKPEEKKPEEKKGGKKGGLDKLAAMANSFTDDDD